MTRTGGRAVAVLALSAALLGGGCRDGGDGGAVGRPEVTTTKGPDTAVQGSGETRQGSGRAKTERREVGDVSRLRLLSSADVRVRVGGEPSLEVTTDDNLLELVTTDVRAGELTVGARGSYSTGIGVKVDVVTRSLDAVAVTGSGDVVASGVGGARFDVSLQGSGDVRASGRADDLDLALQGSGDARLLDLAAARARVRLDGSGDVELTAAESLDVSIRGSGSVVYAGHPAQVASHVSGSGTVRRR
jgi:hypothetical protein